MHLTRFDCAAGSPPPSELEDELPELLEGRLATPLKRLTQGRLVVRTILNDAFATYVEFRVEGDDLTINAHIRQAGREQAAAALGDLAALLRMVAERVGILPQG
jgi:hypothetical protein